MFTRNLYWSLILAACLYLAHLDEYKAQETEPKPAKSNSVLYESPPIKGEGIYFAEHFDDIEEFKRKWVPSNAKKPGVSEDLAKYDGTWEALPLQRFPLEGDKGLVLTSLSRHAAIAARFPRPFHFDREKKFIVQYTIAFQKTLDCGGSYMKLLTERSLPDLTEFNDKTPYTIMFGPDKCGGLGKMHFIIRHRNPVNGTVVEKHCTMLKSEDDMYRNFEPYMFKLAIEPNNDFTFYINDEVQYKGNLLWEDTFKPPINPPKEIFDSTDVKPSHWDDRPQIPDKEAVKPDDWDETEPAEIPDPDATMPDDWLEDEPSVVVDETAVKPDDWDVEMDGEWSPPKVENPKCKEVSGCEMWNAPMIQNPKYRGPWRAPLVENPDYKGTWTARKIPNPDFFYDGTPLSSSPIGYIGFELWSLTNDIYFDDILITDSEEVSKEWTEKTWKLKKKNLAAEGVTWRGRLLKAMNFSPWYWLLYFMYLSVPITAYVMYMKRNLTEASFYKLAMDYTNENPWMWGVYVLVLSILVGFLGTCYLKVFGRNRADYEANAKKTDAYQPDDVVADLNTNAANDGTAPEAASDPEEKMSKHSSEEDDEGAPYGESGTEEEEEEEDEEINGVDDDDEEGGEGEGEEDEDDEEGGGGQDDVDEPETQSQPSPKKRKPRRE